MNKPSDRKEPVLEETLEDNDDAPLLLTRLIREGLPPQLWRQEEGTIPPLQANDHEDKEQIPAGKADAFTMQWEEAKSPSSTISTNTDPVIVYAQNEVHWQPMETATPANPQKDFEDNDLEVALKRLRQGLNQFTSSEPAPANAESAEAPTSAEVGIPEAPLSAVVEPEYKLNAQHDINSQPTEESFVEQVRTEPETSIADTPIEPSPVPENSPLDLDFLKDFEQLLFQEIERRVINEMEEQMIQHLQKVWKEQVSLTLMRTLALEGIKLRESLAQEMRASLPEILQRVLHNGLEQITPTEPD